MDNVFDHVKEAFINVYEKFETTDEPIFILGASSTGKTTILNQMYKKIDEKKFVCIRIDGIDSSDEDYSSLRREGKFLTGPDNIVSELLDYSFANNENVLFRSLIFMTTLPIRRLTSTYFELNEIEIRLLYKLQKLSNVYNLVFIIDDYDKLDTASRRFTDIILKLYFNEREHIFGSCKFVISYTNERPPIKIYKDIILPSKVGKKDFIRQVPTDEKNSESLFYITNGNLGLSTDILNELTKVNKLSLEDVTFKNKNTELENILQKRIGGIDKNIQDMLLEASIIGKEFSFKLLKSISNFEEFDLKKYLVDAEKEALIKSFDKDNENIWKSQFLSRYIYSYFDLKIEEDKYKYHYELALAYKMLDSSNYYRRYKHFKAAGKINDSIESSIIYTLVNYQKFGVKANPKIINNIKNIEKYKHFYESCYSALSLLKEKQKPYKDILSTLSLTDLSPSAFLKNEKYYIAAFIVYKQGGKQDYDQVIDYLLEIHELEINCIKEVDQWMRASILLYLFQVNRLDDNEKAQKIYKQIVKVTAELNQDTCTEYYNNYLGLLSPSILNGEFATRKLERSIAYFKSNFLYYHEYIYSLCNISGVYFYASDYDEGYKYAEIALKSIELNNPEFFKKERIINNLLINGYYASKFTSDEGVKNYKNLMTKYGLYDNSLFLNNYLVFESFNGQIDFCLEQFTDHFYKIEIKQYDKMIYGNNIIMLSLLKGDHENAREILKLVKDIIPLISKEEAHFVKLRMEKINKYITSGINWTIEKLIKQLEMDISDNYWNKILLFTDIQIWS